MTLRTICAALLQASISDGTFSENDWQNLYAPLRRQLADARSKHYENYCSASTRLASTDIREQRTARLSCRASLRAMKAIDEQRGIDWLRWSVDSQPIADARDAAVMAQRAYRGFTTPEAVLS